MNGIYTVTSDYDLVDIIQPGVSDNKNNNADDNKSAGDDHDDVERAEKLNGGQNGLFTEERPISEISENEGPDEQVTLIYSNHEKLPLRDFHSEVRGLLDIQKLQNEMVVLLDLHKSGIDEIVNATLHKMLDKTEIVASYDQARSSLFTHDRVHQLRTTVQCTSISMGGGVDYDQSWICVLATLPTLQARHVGIARLHHPANLGVTCQEANFVIVILAPAKEKGTKTALEMARSFATILLDREFRHKLLEAEDEDEFRGAMWVRSSNMLDKSKVKTASKENYDAQQDRICRVGEGLVNDIRRRIPYYISDFTDGIFGKNTIYKTISTTFFLYFACMLPCIAFGVLNDENTKGAITVEKVVYSQALGGLFFAFLGGTPLIVLLTTAPLALFTKIIFMISAEFEVDFLAMFACVGLWNSFFLIIYSVFGLSVLMKWSTRSTEEIFSVFISIAFSVDAIKNCVSNFKGNYNSVNCTKETTGNVTAGVMDVPPVCDRSISMLYLLLMLGTLWIGVTLYNFTKTPYLTAGKREMLADYALPVSVIIMTFFGSYVFSDILVSPPLFERLSDPFILAPFHKLSYGAIFASMGLGFCLSLLFFMDQNISAALVHSPNNKLKKGVTYHWDLLVIAVINAILSIFNLPWIHAALPHSPMHVAAMADVEERVDQGTIHKIIVYVRETRLTSIFSHILIGLSLLFLDHLSVIPTAVLYGLFLYVAVTALEGNQLFQRIMLLFTEQAAYPPNHYIRRVPQRKIHLFTILQILQLAILCLVGFFTYPYVKMLFPVLLFLLLPIRHNLIPKIIAPKFLQALDSDHH